MRSKVTVVLLFLNVALFAYIYFYDNPQIEKLQSLGAVHRVFGPEAATITSFSRTSRTGETVRLEKRTDSWWLTSPYQWPASPNAVSSLLNAIELLEHDTSYAVADLDKAGQSLAAYGLADPAITFEFTTSDPKTGPKYTVKIGDVTAVANRLYLLSPDGTRIHVVNRSFAEAIGVPLDTLRAPSIFSVPVFEVRSLNVQTLNTQTTPPTSLKVRLRRDAASKWAFEAPINARASKSAVEVTINAVANLLTARNFVEPRDADLERAGLNSPTLQVTLEGNARRETLLVGNPTGNAVPREGAKDPDLEYFAKIEDNPVVFSTAFPKDLLNVLRTAQESLRDPRVLDFDSAAITSLTLVAPGQPELTLQKLEGDQGWQEVVRVSGAAPQTTPADPGVVATLLQKISQLSAHEARPNAPKFLSDAPSDADIENWGFKRPAREITLNFAPGTGGGLTREPTAVTLQIGVSPDKPGEAFARTTNAPFVYQVLPDILDDAPVAARYYRHRTLRELPEAARITSLKLTALPASTTILNLSNPTAITPESLTAATFNAGDAPAGEAAKAAAPIPEKARTVLVSLLGQLRTLRAKAFAAGAFTPDHAETATGPQPWKYQLEIVTAFAAGTAPAQNTTLTLYFTDRIGGTTMLAGTADFGGVVFEVTQELLDAMFALTYAPQHDPGMPAAATAPAANPAPATTTPPPAAAPVTPKVPAEAPPAKTESPSTTPETPNPKPQTPNK